MPQTLTHAHGISAAPHKAAPSRGRIVICGTFRRAYEQLREDFNALRRAGAAILSPIDIAFVDAVDGFVFAAHEVGAEPAMVQARHLEALKAADAIWLHSPSGYVGPSAALELGVAHALGVPVFCREAPVDVTLRHFAEVVDGPVAALERVGGLGTHTPSRPLDLLQDYYQRVAEERGYSHESPQDTMLLLTEEIGELARAVRHRVGLARSGGYQGEDAGAELADVQLYLLHLANVLDVRIGEAVALKERANARKFSSQGIAA